MCGEITPAAECAVHNLLDFFIKKQIFCADKEAIKLVFFRLAEHQILVLCLEVIFFISDTNVYLNSSINLEYESEQTCM